MQKNENTLNEVLIAIQEPSFGGFSAPIGCPFARFSLPLHIQPQLIVSKKRVKFGLPRFEPIQCSSSNQGTTTQAIYLFVKFT